ncbi:DUF5615 family PIN-like protein [Roseobacter sp.]|uniref:DUF5615 family PIN-like protein n=1 Tax=Roseobacter sp. TaxID=1907202 RepID=UPI002966B040|nr:DUF5615 family PIN-like protein [Roseobacter sp.]MDW3183187.1 DUF5615 family PIN-like protein [Roseobacter sp.]
MKFYLDENVPASVQTVLEERGHLVAWTRDILPEGAPDDLVATLAEEDRATLISHDKDFKKIAPRIPDGQQTRFKKLSIVRLLCPKPRSAQRVKAVIGYIEFDYSQRAAGPHRRSVVEVKKDLISIWS